MEEPTNDQAAVRVRPATEADIDAVVQQTWDVAAEGRWIGKEVPFDRDEQGRRVSAAVASDTSIVLVAEAVDGDRPTMVGHNWVSLAPYGVADVGLLVLRPWRGRGVGTRLLSAGIDWARAQGAHKVALEVWPHNEGAIALYRKMGFVEEGRKLKHYRRSNGDLWGSVLMGLLLES